VELDETSTMIGPTSKSYRNTLILREMPTTDVEEIKAIFHNIKNSEGKEVEILEVNSDNENSWFVTFDSDETALLVLDSLREQKFKDQPIQARIKAAVKNPGGFTDGNVYGYPYQGVYMVPYPPGNNYQYWEGGRGNFRGNNFDGRGRGFGRGRRRGGEYNGRGRGNYRGTQPGKESNGTSSPRKRRGSQGNPALPLGSADFPPLPSAAFEQSKSRYPDDFLKYSKQDLIDIVSKIDKDKIKKPQEMPDIPDKVVLDSPATELEVAKPYPKRVTAAQIVQMPPVSPKSSSETIGLTFPTDKPISPEKSKSSKTAEKSHKSPDKSRNGSVKSEGANVNAQT